MSYLCPRPRISFIISVFDGLQFTRACLDSLRQTVNLSDSEVIIVDDLSTDGTRQFLATLGDPPFRVVLNDKKRCFATNNNAAARLASHEILCLLNNDIVLFPGWLEPMMDAFVRFPEAGVIGNVQRNPGTGKYDHMGVVFARDGMAKNFGKHFHFRPFRGCKEWRAVTAACCLIKISVFLNAGGFDEGFINGFEDIDLCLRLGRMGYKHYVINDSVIHHHVSSSPTRRDHLPANKQKYLQRWQDPLRGCLTPRDRWLFAFHSVYSSLAQPWGKRNWPPSATAAPAYPSQTRLPQ